MYQKIKFSVAGKIPNKYLKEIVFKHLGSYNDRIIYGPSIGRDAAAIRLNNHKILVAKSDPITGSVKNIGRHAIIINANDIAVLGATPIFFLSTILLPINSSLTDLETICKDIDQAANELNISVVGGHSEITGGIKEPILCGSMFGETREDLLITTHPKPKDKLVMTKSAAIEGTTILAWDKEEFLKSKVEPNILKNAKNFIKFLSIVKESKIVLEVGGVSAMHDPTEGGILNGIFEICEAGNVGAIIYENRIPIARETKEICKIFELDPLRLISSGTLLISVDPYNLNQLIKKLASENIHATCIGEITEKMNVNLIHSNGTQELIIDQNLDQLWKIFQD